jgi:hypothetical protein
MVWFHRLLVFIAASLIPTVAVLCIFEGPRAALASFFSEGWRELTFPQVFLIAIFVAFYGFLVIWTGRDMAKVRRERYKAKLHEIFHGLQLQVQTVAAAQTVEHLDNLIEHIESDNLLWAEWLLNNMGEAALHKFWSKPPHGMRMEYLWFDLAPEEAKRRRSNLIYNLRDRCTNIEAMLESDLFDPVKPPRRRTFYGRKIEQRTLRPPVEGDDGGRSS